MDVLKKSQIHIKNKLKAFRAHPVRFLLLLGLFAAVLVEAFYLYGPTLLGSKTQESQDLSGYVEQALTACAEAGYRPSCYDVEIPKLMDYISMEEAFEVAARVQERDESYQYCHVLGHNLSAREVQKDMSRWNEIISRCPVGLCANGCLHGAFQERFRAEALTDEEIEAVKPDLKTACDSTDARPLTGLEEATCWHGLGHVVMIMTNADAERSLALCNELARVSPQKDFRTLCYEGLFMQLFQPLEPEDFALVEGKIPAKEALASYCKQFGELLVEDACWGQGWAVYREEIATPAGLAAFCETPEAQSSRDRCYYMLFHVVGQNNNFEVGKIEEFCASEGLPQDRRSQCFANAASSIIQADKRFVGKVIDLCNRALAHGLGDGCHRGLAEFAAYDLPAGSPEFLELCTGLPESLQEACLKSG